MTDDRPSWRQDDEEEEEEEVDDANYIQQKDAVLFAIEVSPSMLKSPPPSDSKKAEKDSPTIAALKCAYQIMQQRIISSPKDMMGVLLFGTEKTKFQDESGKSSLSYPHCYLLSDLDIPAADDVKALKYIVEDEEAAGDILQAASESVSMSHLLFCANQIFTTRAPTFGSRRLFIITDNDDPHSADKNSRSQATVRAKDLYDLGCVIELFPISHHDHEFDRAKFYDDIIYRDPEAPEDVGLAPTSFKSSGQGISLLSNLISDVNSKQVAKRALFSNMPLEIGPDFKISVKGYNILQKQALARSCYIWDKGEELQKVMGTTTLSADTEGTHTVQKEEIKKAYKFAGTQVLFTEQEQKELKTWGSPVIRIIGFKSQSMLPIWASVKKSTFIYPSEESFVGSTRVFSALWQNLLKNKKMGIAWYLARSNAAPVLVAILPSEERLDEATNRQISPAGLWLYQLPFADDLRSLPAPPPNLKSISAPDELIDQMRDVVKQLQLPKGIYDPNKYPNRNLQWHYKLLQALALQEEVPEDMEDKSIPKYRQIQKFSGEYINQWGITLEDKFRAYQKETWGGHDGAPLKRDAHYEDDEKPKKRVKTEKRAGLEGMTNDEVRKLVAKGALGKHSVQELKDFLVTKGVKATGKKTDLLEKVEQMLDDI